MQRSRKRTRRQRRRRDLQRKGLFLLFLLIGLFALYKLADYAVDSVQRRHESKQLAETYSAAFIQDEATLIPSAQATATPRPDPTATPQPQLREKYRTLSGEIPEQARKLYKLNHDLVGWIYVKGAVNLPVVYRDNEFYLTHGFNEAEESGGTIFLDVAHPLLEETQNLVLHGHNMYDNSMFGPLASYAKLDTVKKRAFARFSTMYAPEDYVIFAVLRVNPDPDSDAYFPYIGRARFANTDDFYSYVNALKERSLYEIPVDVSPEDGLLTLATCFGDNRIVVVYRRVRDGETQEELQAQVDMARKK